MIPQNRPKYKNTTLKFDKKNYKAIFFSKDRNVSEKEAEELRNKGWLARLSEGIVLIPFHHPGRGGKPITGTESIIAWIVYTRRK